MSKSRVCLALVFSLMAAAGTAQVTVAGPLAAKSLNGVFGATANQSGTNTRDGIASAFANSLCAAINASNFYNGCRVAVETNYPFDAERLGYNDSTLQMPNYATHPGSHSVDYRGGGEHHVVIDAAPGELSSGPHPWSIDCYTHLASSSGSNCTEINHVNSWAGYSNGNTPVGPQGWSTNKAMGITFTDFGAGITSPLTLVVRKLGIGDVNVYRYVTGRGGFRAASDETLEIEAGNGGEAAGPAYTATVSTVSGTSFTASPVKGVLQQGVGRMVINRAAITTGCATAKTQMTDDQGRQLPVSLYILGCGASIPSGKVAGAWGLLDQDIKPVNQYVSSGPTSQMTDSVAFSQHPLQGHASVGQIACFAGQFHEAAVVTAVSVGGGTSPGDDLVTVDLHKGHNAGSLVVYSAAGCMGMEQKANTYGDPDSALDPNNPNAGKGLRYVLDVIGALDAHTLAVVRFAGAASYGVDDRQADFFSLFTTGPLTNTGGTVRIPILDTYFNYWKFQGLSVLSIGNSDVAAFNGPCTNVTYGNNGDLGYNLYCTQAASTGLTSATSNATITPGDTGYGTTRLNIFSLAEVWDVQNYSGPIPASPQSYLADTFRLEPNALGLAPGVLIEEPNDYAAGYVGQHLGLNVTNPYANEFSQLHDESIGPVADDLNYNMRITNYTPNNFYRGLGGYAAPPHWWWTLGTYSDHGGMSTMPWPSGSAYNIIQGCPPSTLGCADPFYFMNLWAAPGNDDYLRIKYIPYNNTVRNEAAHNQFPRAPVSASGNLNYACMDMSNGQELTRSPAPCVPPPASTEYTGPPSAPTGTCVAAEYGNWVFSQDGHASVCLAGAWVTKI